MSKILHAFKDIADVLPIMDKMKVAFGDSLDLQRVLGLVYSDLLEFITRVYKFLSRKAWHIYFAFDWGLFERRFESILKRLAAHCGLLEREAAATHYLEMKKLRDERHLEIEEYERQRHNRMARDIFRWLADAEDSQEEYLHRLADSRQLGTCDWILEHDKVFSWIRDGKGESTLWMTGIPGAGKSFLCSFIVDHLGTYKDQTTLYYFCGQMSAQRTLSTIYRTLAVQMLRQNLDMVPLVYEALCQKGWSRSSQIVKMILQDSLSNISLSRVVLDGIDEFDRPLQKEILSGIIGVQSHAGDACKILIASRLEPQITKALPSKKIDLTLDGKTTGALHLYIQERVHHLQTCFPRLNSALFERVEQRMKEMARGMFLWVRLVATMLEQQVSELDFEDSIEKLPDGLDEAYRRILSHIESLHPVIKQRALRILFWVCVAYRNVKIYEVADGVALKPGQTVLDKRTKISNLDRDVLEVCAPIIGRSKGGFLDVVHFSAKEYLLDRQSGPFIKVAEAHFAIAFSCITNLTAATAISSLPRFYKGATNSEIESLVVQGNYSLQNYGYHFWADHVQAYFDTPREQEGHSATLLEALEALRVVQKDRSMNRALDAMSLVSQKSAGPSNELAQNPSLYTFVVGQLRFKKDLAAKVTDFENLKAQEEWQVRNDETFLSHINQSLGGITERILRWSPSELPHNISTDDHAEFLARYGFACRFHKCESSFDSADERDAHEGHHTPTFPCKQCDFSGRGFRWKKDLERHKKQYHMSADDFDIPSSLVSSISSLDRTTAISQSRGVSLADRSQCWNARGRKILQRSFAQAFDKVISSIPQPTQDSDARISSDDNKVESLDKATRRSPNATGQLDILEHVRQKIEQEEYQRLSDFKEDIRMVIKSQSSTTRLIEYRDLESLCDQEIMRSMRDVPAFANLDLENHKNKGQLMTGLPQTSLTMTKEDSDTTGGYPHYERIPYWSAIEEEEFPKLVERHGRDFIKISDSLKSKTVDEIEERFGGLLSSGNQDFLTMIADIDAKTQIEIVSSLEDKAEPSEALLSAQDPQQSVGRTMDEDVDNAQIALPQFEAVDTWQKNDEDSLHNTLNPRKHGNTRSATESENQPKRKRRLQSPAFCEACSMKPGGFSDEFALKKHRERYHSLVRRVWLGRDVSIDKQFLARCRACTTGTRYLSKHSASVHLRKYHFSPDTPIQTLERWMEELIEPDPMHNNRNSNPPSVSGPDRLPRPSDIISKQKTNETLHLNRIVNSTSGTDPLSIWTDTKVVLKQSELGPSDFQGTSSQQDAPDHINSADRLDDLLLRDVTFDHLLPTSTISSAELASDTFVNHALPQALPKLAHRALIRPDQVNRLCHLSAARKQVCQDQVDALYHILKSEDAKNKRRQAMALMDLESLSRTLLRDIRSWRRTATLAPDLPISF